MFKKFFSVVLSIAVIITVLPNLIVNAQDKCEIEKYPYVMFANNIKVKSDSTDVNGKVYSNNSNKNVKKLSNPNKKEEMIDKQYSIIADFIFGNCFCDKEPLYSEDDIEYFNELDCNIGSFNNITINRNVINSDNIVLYSRGGDITINSDNFNFKGLIYAPKGTVKITGENINIDGIIISDKININAKNVNINQNNFFAEYLENHSDVYTEKKDIYTYNYNIFGQTKSIYLNDQMLIEYVYNDSFNSSMIKERFGNGTEINYDFTVSNDNVLDFNKYVEVENTEFVADDTYKYDKNYNIIEKTNEFGTVNYVYDDKGQLIRVNDSIIGKSYTYEYDERGNITAKNEYEYNTNNFGSMHNSITYHYDAVWQDKLIIFGNNDIVYDEIGNPTSYKGWNFEWEKGRQLKSASNNNYNIAYTYDDYGLRTNKNVNGELTEFTYIDKKIVEQHNNNNNLIFKYDDNRNINGVNINGVDYYYLKSLQGDVDKIVDKDGNIVVGYIYDPWGKIISITGDLANTIGAINPIRYRGYYYDNETELYYLQSRYYNPDTCRFINADDFCFIDDNVNMFSYCCNNPIKYIDKNGYLNFNAYGYPIINSQYDYKDYQDYINNTKNFLTSIGFKNITDSKVMSYIQCVKKYKIDDKKNRLAHFLSQCAYESGWGKYLTEIGSSSYFASKPYGYKYRGSGYIQLTWNYNYRAFSQAQGDSSIYSLGADYVATNYPWQASGWWWNNAGLNTLIDGGYTVEQVTRKVNGGTLGLADRTANYNKIYRMI